MLCGLRTRPGSERVRHLPETEPTQSYTLYASLYHLPLQSLNAKEKTLRMLLPFGPCIEKSTQA